MANLSGTKSQLTLQAISQHVADLTAIEWLSLIAPINDTIMGTQSNDALSAEAEGDVVFGLDGDDALSSAFNRTALIGGRGNDSLTTNVIVPMQGSEPVHGLAIQLGGKGNDSLDATVTLQGGVVTVQDRELSAAVLVDGGRGNDVINAVANVALPIFGNVTATTNIRGGSGDDVIDAVADTRGALDRNFAKNSVAGGCGDDHITARAETGLSGSFATAINVLSGGDGDDVLDATAIGVSNSTELVSNSLRGGQGDDLLRALNVTDSNSRAPVGINKLWGGTGNDVLEATHSTDGENTVTDVTNILSGGNGCDRLEAESTALGGFVQALNQLTGGYGRDVLTARIEGDAHGGPSSLGLSLYDIANVLKGGAGNDFLKAFLTVTAFPFTEDDSRAENHLAGGSGNDKLFATVASGSVGTSFLNGGAGNDRLKVVGGTENILNGGIGADTLIAGTGDDHLVGGQGADRYLFAPQTGHDTVDFESGLDIIDLTAFAAENIHGFDQLNIEVSGGNSIVHFSAEDDLTVVGVEDLRASDFWFA